MLSTIYGDKVHVIHERIITLHLSHASKVGSSGWGTSMLPSTNFILFLDMRARRILLLQQIGMVQLRWNKNEFWIFSGMQVIGTVRILATMQGALRFICICIYWCHCSKRRYETEISSCKELKKLKKDQEQ